METIGLIGSGHIGGAVARLVVVAVPLKAYRDVPVEPLRGKVVVDANNHDPDRDGRIPELDDESATTTRPSAPSPPSSTAWGTTPTTSARSPRAGATSGTLAAYVQPYVDRTTAWPDGEGRAVTAEMLRERLDAAVRYRDMA